jgi:Tfp pilus assembly protein PilV
VPTAVPAALTVVLVALLALAVVQFVMRQDHKSLLSSAPAGLQGLSKGEQSAVNAAKQETINIQTYRLKSFDSDFSAAVGGMTPAKATEWQSRKAQLKSGLTRIKQDSAATVSGAGLVNFDGKSAVVLVASDSQRIDAKGTSTTFAQNRFQVSMKLTNGRWLMDDLQAVALS